MRGWQIGCLFGLGVGLYQAMSGDMELATLPIDEGVARLAVTMFSGAALCAMVRSAITMIASSEAEGAKQDAIRSSHE